MSQCLQYHASMRGLPITPARPPLHVGLHQKAVWRKGAHGRAAQDQLHRDAPSHGARFFLVRDLKPPVTPIPVGVSWASSCGLLQTRAHDGRGGLARIKFILRLQVM